MNLDVTYDLLRRPSGRALYVVGKVGTDYVAVNQSRPSEYNDLPDSVSAQVSLGIGFGL